MKLKNALLACALALIAGLSPTAMPAVAQEKTKVVFSLDFIPLGRHAPWYVALANGYYEEEGLDVTIIPSQGSAAVIQAVESGTAQIGFVDVPGLTLARAAGSKIKMVAVNYQKAPYAIFSLDTGANVTEASQLEGLMLGSGAGSFTPKVIRGFMAQNGLDPDKLEITNVAPPARASMLLTKQVPSIEFFVMAKPGLEAGAKKADAELRTYLLGDHGLELYSNGIATTEAYLAEKPDVVKGFVRAALKGWKFALDNPEKAAELQMKYVEGLKPEVIAAEIGVVRGLAVTPDTEANGLGWVSEEKMQKSIDFVAEYVGVNGDVPGVADIYASGFLPEEPVKP